MFFSIFFDFSKVFSSAGDIKKNCNNNETELIFGQRKNKFWVFVFRTGHFLFAENYTLETT